jgi:hypothetical protein
VLAAERAVLGELILHRVVAPPLRQREVMRDQPPSDGGDPAELGQPLGAELAQGVEYPVPDRRVLPGR